MFVHDAFGRTRAAGGEEDRSDVARTCRGAGKLLPGGFTDPGQRGAAPEPASPDRDCQLHSAERTWEEDAGCVRDGDRDAGFGCGLLDAAQEVRLAHTRIDPNRPRAPLEAPEAKP